MVTDINDNTFCISDTAARPFINLDPSDMSTIGYIQLLYLQKNEATSYNKKYCVVIFNQPLFIKAVDIIHTSSNLTGVIVRLGRLHISFATISLRSYFYLVVAWKFREVWGLRVKPTAFDLDIGAINVF